MGKMTLVPAQPPLTLHDRESVSVVAAPLGIVVVSGVIATLAAPAANAGPALGLSSVPASTISTATA